MSNSTNNAIQPPPAGTYHSTKFEYVNQKLREHFQQANKEIDKVKEHVNELVVIVHKDNKSWSIKKICEYIAGKNDDFEELGFSARTIYNYLNEENRKLIDTRKYKRQKGDSESQALKDFREQKGEISTDFHESPVDDIVLEDSSSSTDMNEAVESVYDLEDEESTLQEPHVIYDDPMKQIEQCQSQIFEQAKEIQKLREDYERVIPPYQVIETREIDGKKRTQTIHVDPYKRTAWTEQHR